MLNKDPTLFEDIKEMIILPGSESELTKTGTETQAWAFQQLSFFPVDHLSYVYFSSPGVIS